MQAQFTSFKFIRNSKLSCFQVEEEQEELKEKQEKGEEKESPLKQEENKLEAPEIKVVKKNVEYEFYENPTEKPFFYCLSHVQRILDSTVRRGAIVKALAFVSRFPFIHVLKVLKKTLFPFLFEITFCASLCFFLDWTTFSKNSLRTPYPLFTTASTVLPLQLPSLTLTTLRKQRRKKMPRVSFRLPLSTTRTLQ